LENIGTLPVLSIVVAATDNDDGVFFDLVDKAVFIADAP
jgi:hypothetical protein